MRDEGRKQTLDVARALERRGEVDAAVGAYRRIGAIQEAAGALIGAQRYREAGELLLGSLDEDPAGTRANDATGRRLLQRAAICFARAGETEQAVGLFVEAGERERAAELLERSGDHVGAGRLRSARAGVASDATAAWGRSGVPASGRVSPNLDDAAAAMRLEAAGQLELALQAFARLNRLGDAARVALALGRPAEAARLFEESGHPFEAAASFARTGESARSLSALLQVPRDHPRYREACRQAVRIAGEQGHLDFALDNFLAPFLVDAPCEENELEALYILGGLYARQHLVEAAREVFQRVLDAAPGFRDVAERLLAFEEERGRPGASPTLERIANEDASFWGASGRRGAPTGGPGPTGLPDLPPLRGPAGSLASSPISTRSPAERAPAPTLSQSDLQRPVEPPSERANLPQERAGGPRGRDKTTQPDLELHAGPALAHAVTPTPDSARAMNPGATFAARYRIEREIGRGGVGTVYRAMDMELGELVALKVFSHDVDDTTAISRFKQELSVSRQLSHPNIVRLYDIGTHGGRKFISMELLSGHDLSEIVEEGPVELGRGIGYLLQACAGLQEAHDRGVIHRDVKAANLFVTDRDVVKVMDFGLAKRIRSSPGLTDQHFTAGTPNYMAPEQIREFATVTYAADLYSLGVVAFEMFTGTLPFIHTEAIPILLMHLTEPAPSPRSKRPSIPDALDRLILALLAKEPDQRPQSCRAVARELEKLARTLRI